MFCILLVIIGFGGERSISDESVRALARVLSIVVSSMFDCFDSLNNRCGTLSLSLP